MMNEFVHTIMTKNPITLNLNNTVREVANTFHNQSIHHLPVVDDEGNLRGLVTTYDLWELDTEKNADKQVKEIMNDHVVKVESRDKVGTAAELFLDKRFHALPVVEDNKLVGMVTAFDVLRYEFKKEYDNPILYREVLDC
jgi:CBS domain-containing protein